MLINVGMGFVLRVFVDVKTDCSDERGCPESHRQNLPFPMYSCVYQNVELVPLP